MSESPDVRLVYLQEIYPGAVTWHEEEEALSMLKVALRGLDGVERDTGELEPWDKGGWFMPVAELWRETPRVVNARGCQCH